MESPTNSPPPLAATNVWLVGRAALLLAVLSAEVLAFSLCYDVQPLQESGTLIARVASYGTAIFRVVVVAVVALLVIGRSQVPATLWRWTELASRDRTFGWALAAHLIAAACFAFLSSVVLQPNGPPASALATWLWALAGGASLAAWLAALAPIRFWIEWWRLENVLLFTASLLVGVAVYFTSLFASELWIPMSDLTLAVCERLLALVSNDVVCEPASRTLGTGGFTVQIAPECSGYEGIGLVVAVFSLFLVLFRHELRFPQAACLLPVGVVAIWFCNAVRIAALILVGAHISPEIAVSGFHSQAGWIGFAVITIAMSAIALRSPWFAKAGPRAAETAGPAGRSDSAAYLIPLLVMIAAAMVTGAFSAGFDWLYGVKVAAGLAAMWYYRPAYRGLAWSWSWAAAVNGLVVFALWMALEALAGGSGTALAEGLDKLPRFWAAAWLVVRVLGSVLIVPAAEELAFRGYLLRRIMGRDFEAVPYRSASWLAVAVSSVLFGLLHGRFLAGTLAGLAYAVAARRRDMLCDAIVAHAVTNALLAAYVLATQSWQLWT